MLADMAMAQMIMIMRPAGFIHAPHLHTGRPATGTELHSCKQLIFILQEINMGEEAAYSY